jgi:quercetin dioxygenase-like cupin family protein
VELDPSHYSKRMEEVCMRITLGTTLVVLALLTSATGCGGRQKSESAAVDSTTDSTSVAVVGDTTPEGSLHWGPAPAVFPAGAKMAVVSGDPSKEELFQVQLSMPDGYKVPPHFHPTDEVVEVVEGTFLAGMGDKLNPKKTKAMEKGEKGSVPANMHHFGIARGATIVAVSAKGPFAMTYVNPADNPVKN